MRVVVLGGTRFIGLALVEELLGAGHTVAVVHRGEHESADLPPTVEHIHTPRCDLAAKRDAVARFAPDAAVDLAAMTAADAEAALAALDPAVKLVAVSTIESYRVFDSIYAGTVTDAVPLAEDAPLREGPYPAPEEAVSRGWDYDADSYDKLAVEHFYLERGATVCRLPLVYGPRDYKRREDFVLARVRAGRERIPAMLAALRQVEAEVTDLLGAEPHAELHELLIGLLPAGGAGSGRTGTPPLPRQRG